MTYHSVTVSSRRLGHLRGIINWCLCEWHSVKMTLQTMK